jgi:hypothetical protein
MTLKQRVDQHDREIAAIRKLILTGMKMLNQVAAAQKTTEQSLQRLEASVQQLVNGLRRGGNGHAKLNLQ